MARSVHHRAESRGGHDARLGAGFDFIGGHLALDFANTLGGQRGGETRELLPSYEALIAWGREAHLLTSPEARGLLGAAQADPGRATDVLERAHRLREAIYALIAAPLHGAAASAADVSALNAELGPALARRRVAAGPSGLVWAWAWRGGEDDERWPLDIILWPVAAAAADLLVTHEHPPVRECASDACTWLFLDTTRNHSRRWCDMRGCGNRAKLRRYRWRVAAAAEDAAADQHPAGAPHEA